MILFYVANGVSCQFGLPTSYVEDRTAEDLAELAAIDFWDMRRPEQPSLVTLVHLVDVDSKDLGIFEVRRDMRPVFTATALPAA